MNQREGFLRAILAEPHEDTHRLAFADWLEERGDVERSEFIRVQIELAKFTPEEIGYGDLRSARYDALRRREQQLLKRHARRWSDFGIPFDHDGEFRRGFVASLTLSCSSWLTHRDAILRAVPLEEVTMTHLPEEAGYYPTHTVRLKRGDHMLIRSQDGDAWDVSFCTTPNECGVFHWPPAVMPRVLAGDPTAPPPLGIINAALEDAPESRPANAGRRRNSRRPDWLTQETRRRRRR